MAATRGGRCRCRRACTHNSVRALQRQMQHLSGPPGPSRRGLQHSPAFCGTTAGARAAPTARARRPHRRGSANSAPKATVCRMQQPRLQAGADARQLDSSRVGRGRGARDGRVLDSRQQLPIRVRSNRCRCHTSNQINAGASQQSPENNPSPTRRLPTDHREFAGQPHSPQPKAATAPRHTAHRARGRGRLLLARGQGCRRRAPRLLLAAWWWHHQWWAAAALERPRILHRCSQTHDTGHSERTGSHLDHLTHQHTHNLRVVHVVYIPHIQC